MIDYYKCQYHFNASHSFDGNKEQAHSHIGGAAFIHKRNSPEDNGFTAPTRGLLGRLAPFAKADIFPCSFVSITTRRSYSPTGAVDSTIPVSTIGFTFFLSARRKKMNSFPRSDAFYSLKIIRNLSCNHSNT